MKVQNFKSIDDSNEFSLDQVTCLVGKNEAGKTALLEALYKLNPVESDRADFREEEYPVRHLATYRKRREQDPANVLTTTWALEPSETLELEKLLGPDCLLDTKVEITKGYDNVRRWKFNLAEKKIMDNMIQAAKLNASERATVGNPRSTEQLMRVLNSIASPTQKHERLKARLDEAFPEGSAAAVARRALAKRLPHFVFFADYHRLPGRVALKDLQRRKEANELDFSDKVFLALLEMTSTSLKEIESIEQIEKLIRELESIEASLTDEIKRYWSQNRHLEVRFRYDQARPSDPPPLNEGYVFNTRIYNTRHRATVSFEERSHGFIWFFSFLVWFSQVRSQYADNLILLLDEPGLPLHGRAQQDLIRYINERLRPHHQVIYSAHSPFLIDIENIFSLRTVEDVIEIVERDGERTEEVLGTKVGQRILTRERETLFPLQGVLGFDMAQTLFVGPSVVVVEGPTERAFFDWFSRELARRGGQSLDLRWAICPAEGATKISSFVTLFAGRGLQICVLADYHEGQKAMVDRLSESGLLPSNHVLRTSDFTGGSDSDIEDLLGWELYSELINRSLSLDQNHALPTTKPIGAESRIVKIAESHCRLLPPGYSEFDHYKPAELLLTLDIVEISTLPGLEYALGCFQEVFATLNKLLQSGGE
jgi:predicted ATP-dependent endonuclease of OLD family